MARMRCRSSPPSMGGLATAAAFSAGLISVGVLISGDVSADAFVSLAAATERDRVQARDRRREPLPARLSGAGFASVDVLRENTPIDAAAAAFAAATAVAAADVVASLSERRGGAASVFVLAIDGTDTDMSMAMVSPARVFRRRSNSGFGNRGRRRRFRLDYRRGRAWPYRSRRRFQNLGPDFGDRLSRYALVRIRPHQRAFEASRIDELRAASSVRGDARHRSGVARDRSDAGWRVV